MFYRLLGMAVWKGGKLILRRRYGAAYVPKRVLAGAALGAAGALALAVVRRNGSGS